MSFFTPLKNLQNSVQSHVYPQQCTLCHESGKPLCQSCEESLEPVGDHLCQVCGLPLAAVKVRGVCSPCLRERPAYDSHRALFLYNPVLRSLVHDFKYNRGFWMKSTFESWIKASTLHFPVDRVVPVPLHVSKLRDRGFNQSLSLASFWAKKLQVPLAPQAVRRQVSTATQTGLGRQERYNSLKGAFSVPHRHMVQGFRLLLVDDVHTTGATLSELARVLKQAGAREVHATTLGIVGSSRLH